MTVTGDRRDDIPADFERERDLYGNFSLAETNLTLERLVVGGAIVDALINVVGNAGKVRARALIDSSIFIGYEPDDAFQPMAGGFFEPELTFAGVQISGRSDAFVNSYVAAANLGTNHVKSVAIDNGGVPFGFLAQESVGEVRVAAPLFRFDPAGADDQSVGDFHVQRTAGSE